MSASTLIDLGQTCQIQSTLPPTAGTVGSGGVVDSRLSGVMIGQIADMIHANSFCNVLACGTMGVVASGPLVLQVQTSDATTSGSFSDPTSGVAQFPTPFLSGGLLYIGQSGNATVGYFNSGFTSGQAMLSGFGVAAGFQRNARYVRVNVLSGFFAGPLQGLLVCQLKTTGSGGGFSTSPSSGAVSV